MGIQGHFHTEDPIVEVTKSCLGSHIGSQIANIIWKAVNTLSALNLPSGAYLLLGLITVFTRGGLLLSQSAMIDRDRAALMQILFKYISAIQGTKVLEKWRKF